MNIYEQIKQTERAITLVTARYVHAQTREESKRYADSLGALHVKLDKLRAEVEKRIK